MQFVSGGPLGQKRTKWHKNTRKSEFPRNFGLFNAESERTWIIEQKRSVFRFRINGRYREMERDARSNMFLSHSSDVGTSIGSALSPRAYLKRW